MRRAPSPVLAPVGRRASGRASLAGHVETSGSFFPRATKHWSYSVDQMYGRNLTLIESSTVCTVPLVGND